MARSRGHATQPGPRQPGPQVTTRNSPTVVSYSPTRDGRGGQDMHSRAGWICFSLLLTSIVGCSSSDVITLPDANLTGTWNATLTVTGGVQAPVGTQFTATFTIVQAGSTFTGTFSTGGGFSGSLNGTVSSQTFSLTITQGAPCPGTFTGAGTANSTVTQMTGSYSGSDCNGTLAVDFVATK